VSVLPAEAGWAAIVRVESDGARAGWPSDEELALALLEQARVLIHPGALFELDAGPNALLLVANLLAPPDEFAQGARMLAQFLASRPAA
jgi:aspartate/methionine/tyrosine aminotransferase